jgi:ADP-ribose pyrophosphatase
MQEELYQLKSTTEVYRNRWIAVREDHVVRPDGQDGVFGIVTMKPGSTVLAVTDEFDVYLTREYKYGIQQYSLELVSGAIDTDETPLEAAMRELEEELGYQANHWIDMGVVNPFTTVINSPNYMFIAQGLSKTEQRLDEGEILTFEKVHLDMAFQMVMEGRITHGASSVLILKAYHLLRRDPTT